MKGIVFNLLEEAVVAEHSEDVWEAMLDRAGLRGAYTAVGSYDDAEIVALVEAAASLLEIPADDVLRWFGRSAIPRFAARYPGFFSHDTTRAFLGTLNDVIHPEVRKLFPGAYAPQFTVTGDDASISLEYRSHRQLCSFAEGLVEGAAAHFGERITIGHPLCQKRGDETCVLVCSASPQ